MENNEKPKKRLTWIITAIVIVIILISFVVIRIKQVDHIPSQTITPWALNTALAHEASVSDGYPVLATLITQGNVTLTAQIGGTITYMGPREGIYVKAGSLLAQIDTRTIRDNISALKAKLVAAKADMMRKDAEYTREQNLFNGGGSSQSSLDAYHTAAIAAQNEVVSLENQIQALTVNEEYGRITAPVSGIIAARFHEPGDVIMPGQPIYEITTTGGARIHVEFPQDYLKQIKPGTVLQLFHNGDTLNIKLDRIFPLLNGFDLGAAESDLSQIPFNMSNGERITGRIVLQSSQQGIRVPAEAIVTGETDNQSYLFKVVSYNKTNILKKVPVKILLQGRSGVAVSGDIQPGDKVIIAQESVLLGLKDGDPVIINKGGSL
jgi:RND family efflux transporter MFP subunit